MLMTASYVYFKTDSEPYKSGETKELDYEMNLGMIGLQHCKKCNHSFGIWIEKE